MATVVIEAGVCGFRTTVKSAMDGDNCRLEITSDCPDVQRMADDLQTVDPYGEISYRGGAPVALQAASRCLKHGACPVPCGIIKAVEVAAGLALPRDASITVSAE